MERLLAVRTACLHQANWPLAQSCPSVEPHPFRSWEHSTASEPPTEGTLATAPPGSIDPRSSMDEGALPTFRSTRQVTIGSRRVGWTDRSGGPPLRLGLVTLCDQVLLPN